MSAGCCLGFISYFVDFEIYVVRVVLEVSGKIGKVAGKRHIPLEKALITMYNVQDFTQKGN